MHPIPGSIHFPKLELEKAFKYKGWGRFQNELIGLDFQSTEQ